jgi:hypothetical protein
MSVQECSVAGCNTIMCRFMLDGSYICSECLYVLKLTPAFSFTQAKSKFKEFQENGRGDTSEGIEIMRNWIEENLQRQ